MKTRLNSDKLATHYKMDGGYCAIACGFLIVQGNDIATRCFTFVNDDKQVKFDLFPEVEFKCKSERGYEFEKEGFTFFLNEEEFEIASDLTEKDVVEYNNLFKEPTEMFTLPKELVA